MTQSLATLHCAGVEVSWSEFHRPFENALSLLDLPTYSWNDKTYWLQYNGDWALTKGNTFYDVEKGLTAAKSGHITQSAVSTSTVQHIVKEDFEGSSGKVVIRSDLMLADFRAAVYGHLMNGCSVATSVSRADRSHQGRY
jgi:monodictyphenone polyketide synthase